MASLSQSPRAYLFAPLYPPSSSGEAIKAESCPEIWRPHVKSSSASPLVVDTYGQLSEQTRDGKLTTARKVTSDTRAP